MQAKTRRGKIMASVAAGVVMFSGLLVGTATSPAQAAVNNQKAVHCYYKASTHLATALCANKSRTNQYVSHIKFDCMLAPDKNLYNVKVKPGGIYYFWQHECFGRVRGVTFTI